jgi:hypothetical protein
VLFISPPRWIRLVWYEGSWAAGSVRREDEQQRFVMRERHPVCLRRVALDLGGERLVVAGAGLVSAVAGESLVHDSSEPRLGIRP